MFYGYNNNRSIERVNKLLDEGLANFRATPPARAEISKADLEAPWVRTPDSSTSVIRVFSRIRPAPAGAPEPNRYVGRDHLWITSGEVRSILDAVEGVSGSAEGSSDLPASLASRIARYHLVDNVRGEPDMWTPQEVNAARFSIRRMHPGGDPHTLEVRGNFEMQTADGKRALKGTLSGYFVLDVAQQRISRWRAVADCTARGVSTYTPNAPEGEFPLVIAMIEANDDIAATVPPQGLACGGDYLARTPD